MTDSDTPDAPDTSNTSAAPDAPTASDASDASGTANASGASDPANSSPGQDGTPGPDASGDGATVEALLREAGPDAAGALWRLTGTERQLDANVVRLRPGAAVAAHVEPDLDVLVLGLAGRGTLRCAGVEHTLEPGALRLLPRGAERAVAAAAEGVAYLTVHRRRPGLTVRPRA
ncbi:hypothetical protein SAMN05216371_0662 [Streptomyces sp. TLI_053]|uniref:hypothetical protein n=1 Tax=Streptomyces sp. TLI_053 TaxID=1855352 RepID=UPI00087D32C4|nr:hypothetical protein [Streptomyces sp. TLI_053]SDS80985.1 hypothetical protein SAMN05216371_0662 [Streptomyces sp. TLI_053]